MKKENEKKSPKDISTHEAAQKAMKMWFFFYLVCGIVGIVSYFMHADRVLYGLAAIVILIFATQFGANIINSIIGTIWIIVGGILGAYILRTGQGVCLGIMISLVIRHFLRNVLSNIFGSFFDKMQKNK